MYGDLPFALAISLVLTIFFEAGFFLTIGKRNKKDLLLVVLVNMLTNPAVVLLYWLMSIYTDWNRALAMIPLEISAIIVEGHYYKRYGQSFRRPFAFSLVANAFSFSAGFIIQRMLYIL